MTDRTRFADTAEALFRGKSPSMITTQRIGDFVVVEDGQDRWLAEAAKLDQAIERVCGEVLGGDFDQDIDEDPVGVFGILYGELCHKCPAIYSRIGQPSELSAIAELPVDDQTRQAILEALAIESEYADWLAENV